MVLDEAKIQKLIKEGRGQNEGSAYLPFLTVRDVSSQGFSSRPVGWKTERLHQLLSDNETAFHNIVQWAKAVVDIREQYPLLPLESTLIIAESCGIKHPVDPMTSEPVVLTTDFLITLMHDDKRIEHARTIKPCAKLSSKRTIEKFEIERLYWNTLNIDWGIVTEKEISTVVAYNVDKIYDLFWREHLELPLEEIRDIAITLTSIVRGKEIALRHATQACDRRLGHDAGTSLAVAYHLIARRYWLIDMYKPINPGEPIVLLGDNLEGFLKEG